MTLKIALDSNALVGVLPYSALIYERVRQHHALEVYIPVVVYAEQVIHPGSALPEILDAVPATVVSLTQTDADRLGSIWSQVLGTPMDRQKRKRFWEDNKMDCLIAAMALQREWLVVTNNVQDFSYFKTAGLRFCSVTEFVTQVLSQGTV